MWCCSFGLQSAPGETSHPGLLPRRLEPCLLFVHDDLEPLKVIGPYLLGHFLFLFTAVVIYTYFYGCSLGLLSKMIPPVSHRASSDARKGAINPMSSGMPVRPSGVCALTALAPCSLN